MDSYIVECELFFPSIARASKLVPPEFLKAWNWYQTHEGAFLSRLPMKSKNNPKDLDVFSIKDLDISLIRQAGIHSPDYENLPSKGAGKDKYVLAIHTTKNSIYKDKEVLVRDDGTWILDYCAHRTQGGEQKVTHFNDGLMKNMRDGVPVGVLTARKDKGYTNRGLAFVEQYNPITDSFILHGPVTLENEDSCKFALIESETVTNEELDALIQWDCEDERVRAKVSLIRRQQQKRFRDMLLKAYEESCAVTEFNVPEALQAAHIDPYRGKKSQVVTNGILLRSDVHLLYDAHLLTIEPENMSVVLGERLKQSEYKVFDGKRILLPSDPKAYPDEKLLDMHRKQFDALNSQ